MIHQFIIFKAFHIEALPRAVAAETEVGKPQRAGLCSDRLTPGCDASQVKSDEPSSIPMRKAEKSRQAKAFKGSEAPKAPQIQQPFRTRAIL